MTRCLRGYLRFGGNVSSFVLAGFVLSTAVHADDWPQWRGQDRRAVWDETGIVEDLLKGDGVHGETGRPLPRQHR